MVHRIIDCWSKDEIAHFITQLDSTTTSEQGGSGQEHHTLDAMSILSVPGK